VRQRELLESHDSPSSLRDMERRCASHPTEADDDRIVAFHGGEILGQVPRQAMARASSPTRR
jgi:hypothetical protein